MSYLFSLTLCIRGKKKYVFVVCDFFFKINFFEIIFQEYHQSVKQFGSRFVEPDLLPNYLRTFSADDTWRQRVKKFGLFVCFVVLRPSQQLWSLRDGQFT